MGGWGQGGWGQGGWGSGTGDLPSTRVMTPAVADATGAEQVAIAIMAELHFKTSVQYAWSGRGTIAWNGQNWLGLGALCDIGAITEDTTLTAQGVSISLSGIDSTMLSEALTEVQQGLPVKLYLTFFDTTGAIIPNPVLVFAGRMDQPSIDEGADTSKITIEVENRLADLQRPLVRRFTDQDQRMDFPRDNGFAYVAQLMDWNSAWGVASETGTRPS